MIKRTIPKTNYSQLTFKKGNMSSKVYFTNLRAKPSLNLLQKLEKLVRKAGIEQIDFNTKFTAIKIHFGEPGNLAYIRPNFAAQIVKIVDQLGGKPFLTDTNTLYTGRRSNAVDHLKSAFENGFNPMAVNCPVIIADGLRGTDIVEVPIDKEFVKSAKIGKAINDADVFISLNHFKGHELAGFGGAIKNIGMGCASVMGKKEQHSSSTPKIVEDNCTGCNMCVKSCAHDAIHLNEHKIAFIDKVKCVGCGQCIAVCQYDAAQVVWNSASEDMNRKMAEYTFAVLDNKPAFHINFIMNVSPDCDCWGFNDYPLVADIGIAASFDPVALDQASADLVMEAPCLPGSRIGHSETCSKNHDKFKMAHPNTKWEAALIHAEKMDIGTRDYELIRMDKD